MKQFEVIEQSSGCPVDEIFEAEDLEEAQEIMLENMGYTIREVENLNEEEEDNDDDDDDDDDEEIEGEIIITVSGGVIQEVEIPEHLKHISVIVHDYDTDGVDEDMLEADKDGDFYVISYW